MTNRITDAWGRTILCPENISELILQGHDVWDMLVKPSSTIDQHNKMCRLFDKSCEFKIASEPEWSPEEEHKRRANTWLIPDILEEVNIREFLLSLCETEEEIDRINMEMNLYEERNLEPVLRLMIFLVDHFRTNNIVWGVGRGSSVSSYALYLIGIHKINSIKFDLDIREFLK